MILFSFIMLLVLFLELFGAISENSMLNKSIIAFGGISLLLITLLSRKK